LNEQINENIALKNQLIAHQCAEVFVESAKGLADTEVEKFASLAEGIEFDSVEQYKEKLNVLRESYFSGTIKPAQEISENTSEKIVQNSTGNHEMDTYVKVISEQLKLTNNKKVL
jgi:hypothetical protein